MIDTCSFGIIVVEGKKYTSDLIIYPDGRVEDCWRRKRGHNLSSEDIKKLIESCPEVIVAGTGVNGLMRPDDKLEKLLHKKGIKFIPEPNRKAMEIYNELSSGKRVGACFHLTC